METTSTLFDKLRSRKSGTSFLKQTQNTPTCAGFYGNYWKTQKCRPRNG